ncbi:hypothetical protein ACTPEM_24315, partial [Clostridioides difficile]
GTKAKMISNITGGKKEKDITQAMVDVRALNMNTSSEQDVSAASNYMEIPSIELIVDGVESIYHKDGTIEKVYMKKSSYDMFFNSK